ncbi:MazG-like pyrophosphatase [Cellulophaga phage phi13:2]|uniref:Nucleoside triphosphate pyrophosphohydrolase, MazG n=2 Tax=Baltivirus TaxID=2946816 RepID=R9ZZ19_9CAUD|nr:MazG-like pyrophosphatase [Cellulophaga phage phi18:3]YP_008242098.1 MazG-like pyrophosphatase [Cellulophaga phage phi13:2]AGO48584.1 nucleoside triphosphate pyrophosphohydrolase, MazG [Cellulophaga phage phi18:3]AGO49683.1 nucleoside triphosphate pyrophosphohydrolase, MazG [Cellulophaga phage phi13:2]
MTNRFKEANSRVIQWAAVKGILAKATPLTQHSKTEEEVAELKEALYFKNNDVVSYKNSKGKSVYTDEEVKDAIGDILVTLLIQCGLQDLDPLDCLESALDVIENRTGRMVNGQFVKDE